VKLVTLLVGALVVVLAVILDEVNERNDWLGAGLLLFSLTASTYFFCLASVQRRRAKVALQSEVCLAFDLSDSRSPLCNVVVAPENMSGFDEWLQQNDD